MGAASAPESRNDLERCVSMLTVQKLALVCAAGIAALSGVAAVSHTSPAPAPLAADTSDAAPMTVQLAVADQIRASVAGLVASCGSNAHASVIAAPGTPREAIDKILTRIEEGYYGEVNHSRFQPADRWGGFGQRGNPVALTYSFPPDGISIGGGGVTNEIFSRLNGIYGSAAVWQDIFAEEFDRWAEVTGVQYAFSSDDGATWTGNAPGPFNGGSNRGDIRIVMGDLDGPSNVLAFNSFPDDGDMFMDVDESWGSNTFFRNVITHEHGHGMGLAHTCPDDTNSIGGFPILMKPFIDTSFLGPQFDDQLSMQYLYGDRFEPNATGPGSVNLPALGQTNNGLPITIDNMTLHSSSDNDLFRFENFGGTEISVFLQPIGPTYFEGPQNGGGGSGCVGNSGGEFDGMSQGDLRIEILEPNFSVTAGGSVDANPVGGSEFINLVLGDVDGDSEIWYVRVRAGDGSFPNTAQMYDVTITTEGGGGPGNPADFTGDGCVDSTDLAILLANWDGPGADIDGDGNTDSTDLAIMLASWTGPGC